MEDKGHIQSHEYVQSKIKELSGPWTVFSYKVLLPSEPDRCFGACTWSSLSITPPAVKTDWTSLLKVERQKSDCKSRKHTPSGIQTGDETSRVVFSSTETVQSIATKRQPSFAVHSVSHNLVQNPNSHGPVHSPEFHVSQLPYNRLVIHTWEGANPMRKHLPRGGQKVKSYPHSQTHGDTRACERSYTTPTTPSNLYCRSSWGDFMMSSTTAWTGIIPRHTNQLARSRSVGAGLVPKPPGSGNSGTRLGLFCVTRGCDAFT